MDSTGAILGILAAGIVTVIGGVLLLRLHAFLALILGALLVGMLTPNSFRERYVLEQAAFQHIPLRDSSEERLVIVEPGQYVEPHQQLLILRPDEATGAYQSAGSAYVERIVPGEEAGSLLPIGAVSMSPEQLASPEQETAVVRVEMEASEEPVRDDDLLVDPRDAREARRVATTTVGAQVAQGFGSTCANIGILIAMASIIGKCLLDSGAADRIVRFALRLFGERGAPFSFLSSGFLLAIPVFFDTVFYLMIPLGKAMTARTGRNYLLYVLTIVAGGTMAHSLVPPTPGPLFVAEQLNVDIGLMILAGCLVGLFTSGFGFLYAVIANRLWELPLRESPDFSLKDLDQIVRRNEDELPPLWLSLFPILLPVFLIGGYTVLKSFSEGISPEWMSWAATLGDKNIALVISAAIALLLLVRQQRKSLRDLSGSIQSALSGGGVIILITAGGGAFGKVLQQTGVANLIRELPSTSPAMIVLLAFLITTAIRTAQGSSTVAMITAVGLLAGLGDTAALGFHPVYLALAIGCGSKPLSWMNDSGFWVISKMSGMTESEGLKYITPMTGLMGIVGLVVLLIGVTLFPLV